MAGLRRAFLLQQRALAVDAPAVAGESAVVAHDAMAGNGEGELVCGAGTRDGANGFRGTDAPGDLGVGRGGTQRDGLQSAPDLLLKRRAADIEREVEAGLRGFDEGD